MCQMLAANTRNTCFKLTQIYKLLISDKNKKELPVLKHFYL